MRALVELFSETGGYSIACHAIDADNVVDAILKTSLKRLRGQTLRAVSCDGSYTLACIPNASEIVIMDDHLKQLIVPF